MEHAIRNLARKMFNLLVIGRITAVNDSGGAQILQALDHQGGLLENVKFASIYGFSSNPPIHSDVVILTVGGDRSNAIAISTGNQTARAKGLQTGDVSMSNGTCTVTMNGSNLTMGNGQVTLAMVGGKLTITAPDGVEITSPTVQNTGEIIAKSGGGPIHVSTHTHTDSRDGLTTAPTAGS